MADNPLDLLLRSQQVAVKLADRHAAAVTALERVTAPVFAVVGAQPTEPRTLAAKKKRAR